MEPSVCTAGCGDGTLAGAEECDDGNPNDDDGCSASCDVEPGWTCPPGMPCFTTCGDTIRAGLEACDDGDAIGGDGCDATCTAIETGYTCPIAGGACSAICGDTMVVGDEACDDGGMIGGDGCSANCATIEFGFDCPPTGGACAPICGDNTVLGQEACDDGNVIAGDGCNAACTQVEPGFTCPMAGGACSPICGDNLRRGSEVCDDGDQTAGDGCNATCSQIEAGYNCPGTGGDCTPICGDTLIRGGEACDDGNILNNDGCNSTCTTVEPGYTCPPAGGSCSPVCGDNLRRGAEACDDGDSVGGNGCSANCAMVEPGWMCPAAGGACTPICGDGLILGAETCDDGNQNNGDGCNSVCMTESGYACVRQPSLCSLVAMTAFVDDNTCPGTGTGTPADPYCTIDQGLAANRPTVIIRPGTYSEALSISGRQVGLIAEPGVTLDEPTNATPAIAIGAGGEVTIVGLTITGGNARVTVASAAATIRDVRIGPEAAGLGIAATAGATIAVDRTRIIGNGGGGISLDTDGTFTLTSVIVAMNGTTASAIGGVYVARSDAASDLVNLTVADNLSGAGVGVFAGIRCDQPTSVVNTIVFDNLALGLPSGISPLCQATYSDLEPFQPGTGNFSTDPNLDATYHLNAGSPAIDNGDPLGVTPAGPAPRTDIDGEERPQNGIVDVGADEVGS